MNRRPERPTGAVVNRFDEAKLRKAIIAEVTKHNPANTITPEQLSFPYGHVAMYQKDGVFAVINTEGVGEREYQTDNSNYCKLIVAVGMSFADYFAMPVDELKKALSKDTTDLSTFIRSFGDRLEMNFRLWFGNYGRKVK